VDKEITLEGYRWMWLQLKQCFENSKDGDREFFKLMEKIEGYVSKLEYELRKKGWHK
jgi:hypothetical protein